MNNTKKSIPEILKEQLKELCELNFVLLEKAKTKGLDELEIEQLSIVNKSIYELGNLFKGDMSRW